MSKIPNSIRAPAADFFERSPRGGVRSGPRFANERKELTADNADATDKKGRVKIQFSMFKTTPIVVGILSPLRGPVMDLNVGCAFKLLASFCPERAKQIGLTSGCAAPSGLNVFWMVTQGSAALHPGLNFRRRFAATDLCRRFTAGGVRSR